MTRTRKQQQLSLPELEPALATEQTLVPPGPETPPEPRPSPKLIRLHDSAPPRRKAKAASPRPAVSNTSPPQATAISPLPQLAYNRQDNSLRIQILGEPILEDRRAHHLSAGYTADGRLAEIRILDLPQAPASPSPDVAQLGATLNSLKEELLFLKTGLGIVLACVLWLVLR